MGATKWCNYYRKKTSLSRKFKIKSLKTKTLTVDLRQVKIHLSIIVALLHGLDNKEFNDTKI